MEQANTQSKLNGKHLLWIIPLCIVIGILIGFYISIPKKIDIVFEVRNDTRDWFDGVYKTYNTSKIWENVTNMCCFPSNCPEAVKNPKRCTCVYMVECFNESID